MNYSQYYRKIKTNWRSIIVIVLIVMALSLITNTFREPLYKAQGRILVTQNTNLNMDMYQASQSAERLAILLAKIIKSSSFLKDVLNSGFPIDRAYFPKKEKDLRKKWAEMVDSRVSTDTSIIEINVYHPQRQEAKKIANAIIYTFAQKGKTYYGASDQIGITVIDTPLVSEKPVKPSIWLNIVLSFFVGLLISGIYIAWKSQKPPKKIKPPKKERQNPEIPLENAPENLGAERYIGGLKIVDK